MSSRSHRMRPVVFLTAIAISLAALPIGGKEEQPPAATAPGFVERAAVELLLLEVEAVDADGRPLRGLRLDDFVVRLDGRAWPIVSVDDFCGCAGPAAPPPPAAAAPAVSAASPATAAASASTPQPAPTTGPTPVMQPAADADAGEPARFVLYFDFGQMRQGGRHQAVSLAKRWLREVKADRDEVMIAGYITRRGFVTLAGFTSDRERLLEVLDRAYDDLGLVDDWAVGLDLRIEDCRDHPDTCLHSARLEYTHGLRALKGLRIFLEALALQPGRKTVLYFHENGMMEPGAIYGRPEDQNLMTLAESVGAEATLARASVYPLLAGRGPVTRAMQHEVLNLGVVLAEATGGAYNRGASDFERVAIGAGRGCRCLYLLGLEPPPAEAGRVYAASVWARGLRLPHLYRVRPLEGPDRWLRRAAAILDDPATAQDLQVSVAIVPLRVTRNRWDVSVQVAIDAQALVAIPRGDRQEANWEVGARLRRMEGRDLWEMLGVAEGSAGGGEVPDATLLHVREISGLRPGRYRLTAFVRDRLVNAFGGAEAILDLPDPAQGGVAGPVPMRIARARVVSSLPPIGDRAPGGPGGEPVRGSKDLGPTPVGRQPMRRGETLAFESWVCRPDDRKAAAPVRYISLDDVPVFRLEGAPGEGAGPCVRMIDEVPTRELDPGRYEYVLRAPIPSESLSAGHASFTVIAGEGSQE